MISYVTFGANDIQKSVKFFDAVLPTLGYSKFYGDDGAGFTGYAIDGNPENPGSVWLGFPYDKNEAKPSNGMMVGFVAPTRQAVRDFHAAALANGGTSEGDPGLRELYGPNMYLAYVRDPIGNKFSALCTADSE